VIIHWNGRAWTQEPSPTPAGLGSELYGVAAISASDAWVVGDTVTAGGDNPLIEHWNGRSWTLVPSPALGASGQLAAVADLSPDSAWAVGGGILCPGQGAMTVIEHWNGRSWALVPSPASGELTGVVATSPASAWAVGFWTVGATAIIEHWNGRAGFCASPSGPGCLLPGSSSPVPSGT
jgi:hypothetical protein